MAEGRVAIAADLGLLGGEVVETWGELFDYVED